MQQISQVKPASPVVNPSVRDFDVLIVGAGISGIGKAQHLLAKHPERSFVVLETRNDHGGTWQIHNYPGTRSDSDLYTFGYRDRPWSGVPIAKKQAILNYLDDTIQDNGLTDHIRYGQTVTRASWSSENQRWELQVENGKNGKTETYRTRFLWMCQGYYDHNNPYTPEWPGMDSFEGPIIHPQKWPEDLAWQGKRILVIGSGATAATLIPNLADEAAHVTMLQRSPTFFHAPPNRSDLAEKLEELEIPAEWTHEILRRSYLAEAKMLETTAANDPEAARTMLMDEIRKFLGPDFDVEKHFSPSYRPWQQRLASVPNGDMFVSIKSGKASVVTDQIERFTPKGIALKSGETLEADIIITATGFRMQFVGDIPFDVDGEPVSFPDTVSYRGLMVAGVPNMAFMLGYLRTSWTMRVDLSADFICRLLSHMDARQAKSVTPILGAEDAALPRDLLIPQEEFNAGYITRGLPAWPKRIEKDPWRYTCSYYAEREILPNVDLDEPELAYA